MAHATVVLAGDVGAGKSTLVEKLTGHKDLSSDSMDSFTRACSFFWSSDGRLQIVDTPGTNPFEDRYEHNLHIAYALNFAPVTRVIIVVKAETRTDVVLRKIEEYAAQFADLGLELLVVCVTHMDTVTWTESDFLRRVEQLGIDTVLFSGKDTPSNRLLTEVQRACSDPRTGRWRAPERIHITAEKFLQCFKIHDSNLRILKAVRQEVADFETMHRNFKEQLKAHSGDDRADLVFSYQAWIMDAVAEARARIMEKFGFTLRGDKMPSEAGHLANLTNQVRGVIFEVRMMALKYQRDAGVATVRKCPHCGLPWALVEGCPDTTCGAMVGSRDGRQVFTRFSFLWDSRARTFHVQKTGVEQLSALRNARGGLGCGRPLNWETMQPVHLPSEFTTTRTTVSMADVQPLAPVQMTNFEDTFKRGMRDVQAKFAPAPREAAATRRLPFQAMPQPGPNSATASLFSLRAPTPQPSPNSATAGLFTLRPRTSQNRTNVPSTGRMPSQLYDPFAHL